MRSFVSDLLARGRYLRYRERETRARRVWGLLFVFLNFAAGAIYLSWSIFHLNWQAWYISVPFFLAEAILLAATAMFQLLIWYPRHHRADGVAAEISPSVDVFITTCGEPIDILTRTVAAATRIRYERKNVFILDDAGSPEVEALAWHLGCEYLARADRRDAKAGNLNFGLASTDGDLVLALDADQVPDPEILQRLVGYFKIPSIAFVQTTQRFILPESDPFGNADELFFEVIQRAKDSDNSAFSCGSGVVYRRSALESVGGFSTWNLVEDLHTSMKLHARGWRSVYHDHPLTTGTAPADVQGVYKQRGQWATDTMRMFFWDNPLKRAGLSFRQKLQYFYIGLCYLTSAFVLPIFYIIPIWSLLTGDFVLIAPLQSYLGYRGVYLLFTVLSMAILWMPVHRVTPYRMWVGLFPVFMKSTFQALRSRRRKPSYTVTSKTLHRPGLLSALRCVTPQVLVIASMLGAIAYGVSMRTLPVPFIWVNAIWGAWIIWSLSGICLAALKPKRFAVPARGMAPAIEPGAVRAPGVRLAGG